MLKIRIYVSWEGNISGVEVARSLFKNYYNNHFNDTMYWQSNIPLITVRTFGVSIWLNSFFFKISTPLSPLNVDMILI